MYMPLDERYFFFISENEPSEAEQDEEEKDYQEDKVDEGKEPVLFLGHPGWVKQNCCVQNDNMYMYILNDF